MLPWYGGKIGFMANEDRKKERAFAFAFVRSLFPVCAACHLYLYSLDGDLIEKSIFCAVPHQYALLLTANMRIARVLVS